MENLLNYILNENLEFDFFKIKILNEITYIGDSVIFFWPLVNALERALPDKEISVFHSHINLFKPLNDRTENKTLSEFYEEVEADKNTLIIAFLKSDGQLKAHLKLNGFQAILKGMVGMDFSVLNSNITQVSLDDYERLSIDDAEIKYLHKNREIDIQSGFPRLNKSFSNVYEYAKICNESFLGLKGMEIACKENIIFNEFNTLETFADFCDGPSFGQERKYILINLICGTFKEDVHKNYTYLLNWIKEIGAKAKKEDIDVWLFVDSKFPSLRNDLNQYAVNLFYFKEHSSLYWTTLIKKAEKVYSIDTGFLHIAHILNKNTFGFGGDVNFWFFKDRIIEIEKTY